MLNHNVTPLNKHIVFVAGFQRGSTNISQANDLERLGVSVIRYDHRVQANKLGSKARDEELLKLCLYEKPDTILLGKVTDLSLDIFKDCPSKLVYWFPDPMKIFNESKQFLQKFLYCDIATCAKRSVRDKLKSLGKDAIHIVEGYDSAVDKVFNLEKGIDVSFIGSLYNSRKEKIKSLNIFHVTGAYGEDHAKIVCKSKININFCTTKDASDRVYKVLASGGFLITEDWIGRKEEGFKDGIDLVIADGIKDFKNKIDYYLEHKEERDIIAQHGMNTNKKYSRLEWAKKILELL